MNKEDLEKTINEFQNLETQEEKDAFLLKQRNVILSQDKSQTMEGFESIKNKLKELRQKNRNTRNCINIVSINLKGFRSL
jgi:hypothetical protein